MNRKVFRNVLIFIFALLILDQILKIYIKTHFLLGEEVSVIGHWFRLNFVENIGMAFGLHLKGAIGKFLLSIFRIIAASAIMWYLLKIIREKKPLLYIFAIALIFAGATGNIIDSMFYGLVFESSSVYGSGADPAVLFGGSYAGFLQGKVVDMFYFPILQGHYPSWIPFKGGEQFLFFRPVFNLADSYISIAVVMIIIFQRRMFPKEAKIENEKTAE